MFFFLPEYIYSGDAMATERFNYSKKRKRGRKKRDSGNFLIAVGTFLCIAAMVIYYVAQMRILPALSEIALSKLQDVASIAIIDAINKTLEDESATYSDIVELKTDTAGNIIAIETKTANVNRLQSNIVKSTLDALSNADTLVISVPMGKLFSDYFFSEMGPMYEFRVLTTTSVVAKLENVFTDAGINQTRHQIMLKVQAPITVIIKGQYYMDTIELSVCVAETILVGKVPDIYAVIEK